MVLRVGKDPGKKVLMDPLARRKRRTRRGVGKLVRKSKKMSGGER